MSPRAELPDEVLPVTPEGTEPNFDVPVDYLKIGSKVFAVREVAEVDIHKEIRDYYKGLYDAQKGRWQTAISRAAEEEWSRQMDHIRAAAEQHRITIPEELTDYPVMYHEHTRTVGRFIPILYHPWKVVGTRESFAAKGVNILAPTWASINPGDPVEVLIKSDVFLPGGIAFYPKLSLMYLIGLAGFHSMGDYSLCYASRNYAAWEKLSAVELSKQASIINLDSLARQDIVSDLGSIALPQVLNNDTIISVKKEDITTWRVQ